MDDINISSTPENSVVYRGFVISSPSRPPPNLAEISGFRQACLNSLGHRLAGYVWQEESFNLTAVERSDIAGFPHLVGSTHFGDNIDDEWFIVDLLFHLSELFPNLAFQV